MASSSPRARASLVLEAEEHARARGAGVLAELAGYGSTADGHHLTAPDPRGRGAVRAMHAAIRDAGLRPADVDVVNAHGTSTSLNDVTETRAIHEVFGAHAARLAVHATKSMTGHALGGSAAIEAVASALTLMHGIVHPTINQDDPDPQCDLDYVPNQARQMHVATVMSNSFGFGGINGVLVFRAAGMAVCLLVSLVLGFAKADAAASNAGLAYHVATTGSDSADGSAAHPWRTLQRAAIAVRPGATVHVAPGRYASGMIDARESGTANARIRFVSDSTWGARIYVRPASRFHYAWRQAGSFTDISGFDLSGDGFTGIDILGDDVRVTGNHVHGFPNFGSGGGAGILNEEGQRALISGNVVHDIGNPDSANGLVHGIYLSRGSRGAIVQNNIVYRNQSAGIHTFHTAEAATISNNTVFANANWGILIGGSNGSVADSFVVTNNIVFDNGGAGIVEWGTTGSHNRFSSNLVYQNRSAYEIRTSAAPRRSVTADPMFVHYRRDGSGDYHLARGSPCIDAGTALGAPATDYDGRRRPEGGAVDIGAFEHP